MSLHSRAKRSNSQLALKATSVDTLDDVLVLIKNAGYAVDDNAMTAEQSKKSVESMDLLAEILTVQDKVESLNKDINKFKDVIESYDIVRSSEIEKKIKQLVAFSNHVHMVMNNKQVLVKRLREPYAGPHITLQAEYHRPFACLIQSIVESINSLPEHIESVKWVTDHGIFDKNAIDKQVSSTASTIATYGNYADCIERVRKTVKEMQETCVV
ncbi:5569_t:CDS:2 [Paraglomus occultum]|uniref:5569_t:CDS:1 n=1 Tax=Paraglomus occultum TaxID=144539 RepID=A0A9N8ZA00_9GLOM|nr:5569_t:CDS:2 [Paraglomus occultum]